MCIAAKAAWRGLRPIRANCSGIRPIGRSARLPVPRPVVVGDGRIFFSGGYGAGSLMLQLSQEQGRIVPHTEFRLSAKQFGSEQQTPILYDGHLYGVRQKDQQLVCLDLQGKELWNSGRDKFGSAPYMIADGLIYAMNDEGVLTMAEASSAGYKRLARATVIDDGVTAWGPIGLGQWPFDRARPNSNDVRGCSGTLTDPLPLADLRGNTICLSPNQP